MSFSIYKPDIKVTELLRQEKFSVSAEVIPPRNGVHQSKVLNQIERLVDSGTQFLSVTKGAGGSLRGGSLPIAQVIKERFGRPCIAHFTCRDLTPEEVENQLIDHHYFGIRNILALRGDPPRGQQWHAKLGSYDYAYQLMNQIRNLNQGKFLDRKGYKLDDRVETDFCIGAAVYPDHPHKGERIDYLKLKVEHGAEYGITQMVFSKDSLEEFLNQMEVQNCVIPILAGTRVLKNRQQALRMASRFEVAMPKAYLSQLPDESEDFEPERAANAFMEFVESLKGLGLAGVHLFVLTDTELSVRSVEKMLNRSL